MKIKNAAHGLRTQLWAKNHNKICEVNYLSVNLKMVIVCFAFIVFIVVYVVAVGVVEQLT